MLFNLAKEDNVVTIVADDTDIMVLVLYHCKNTMSDIYFQSELKRSQKKSEHMENS